MKKKIFKYIKFIFYAMLIFSLMVPTHAAISSSDGASFVTKGEHDAVMADFNSRLATFETGINKKIDSQVASYLERNGIWNRYEQVVNPSFNSEVRLTVGSTLITVYAQAFSSDGGGGASQTYDKGKAIVFSASDDCTLVEEVSKAGLCCIEFKITTIKNRDFPIACAQLDHYALNHSDWFNAGFTIKDGDGVKKYTYTHWVRFVNATILRIEPEVKAFGYFFVKARDKLIVDASVEKDTFVCKEWALWDGDAVAGQYWGKKFEPIKLTIY